jgi:hypothetical protein
MYEIPAGASAAQILELFDQGRVVLEHHHRGLALRRPAAHSRQSRRGDSYPARQERRRGDDCPGTSR